MLQDTSSRASVLQLEVERLSSQLAAHEARSKRCEQAEDECKAARADRLAALADRDEARARRRKERDRRRGFEDADDRLPAIVDDDDYDSVDGDDFMSRGGRTPAPGPRDPNGGNARPRAERSRGEDTQNWLSSCSFIPGLDYCAMAPPAASKGRGDGVD